MNCYKKSPLRIFLIFFYIRIFISVNVLAQGFNIYNPVEISQPWISEINPAIISSQYSRVSLGLKVFHLGFLPERNFGLNESHINVSFPYYLPFGIGCGLRYFSAGIYSRLAGSVMLSKEVIDRFSIGVKVGMERFSFIRQDFDIVDVNDPLLVGNLSKTCLNLGFGVYWNNSKWSVGLGIDRINHPDIGFQTSAILPQEMYAGVGYKFGNIMPVLLFHNDGNLSRYGFAVSFMNERFGLFRISFDSAMPFKIEAQLNLSKNNSLQYGLDLPTEELSTVSTGSHEIVYNHILGRGPDIAQPRVLISTDTMTIYKEFIVRSMPPELSVDLVENLDELIPEYLEVNGKYRNLLIVPSGFLNQNETRKSRLHRYVKLGREIKQRLLKNPKLNLILQTTDESIDDAKQLKHFLLQHGITPSQNVSIAKLNSSGTDKPKLVGFVPGQQKVSHKPPVCSIETLIISFFVPGKTRQVSNWKFIIYNDQKDVIKTFNGNDKLPKQLEWDWKNNQGELVTPGRYLCLLSLQAISGKKKFSVSQPIQIVRLNRTIELRFSQDPQLLAIKNDLK